MHLLEHLAEFAENLPISLLLTDCHGNMLYHNKQLHADLMTSEQNLLNKSYNILHDPAIDESTRRSLREVLDNDGTIDREMLYSFHKSLITDRARDYTLKRWFKIRASRSVGIDGELILTVLLNDITARKNSERKFMQNVKELRILNEIILSSHESQTMEDLYVGMMDKVLSHLNFSTGLIYLSDYEKNSYDVVYSQNAEQSFMDYIESLDLSLMPFSMVFVHKEALFFEDFGRFFPEEAVRLSINSLAIIPLYNNVKILGAIFLSSRNKHAFTLSERRVLTSIGKEIGTLVEKMKTEVALRESEERYRSIFQSSALAICRFLPSGEIVNANSSLINMLKYESELDFTISIKTMFAHSEDFNTMLAVMSKDKGSDFIYEAELKRVDGSLFIGKIILRGTKNDRGEVVLFEAFIEDVTEQKKAEERIKILNKELERRVHERTLLLKATNQELEAFAYSVSHDLRAPLRAIEGFSLALFEDYYELFDDQARDFINRVRNASQRMAKLIDDMQKLSAITQRQMNLEKFSLSEMSQQLAAELKETIDNRDAEVIIEPGMMIEGDRRLMNIAMENLLSNALKFTSRKQGAKIRIYSIREDSRKIFVVEDNGAGFDMKYSEKLFNAFQRLHRDEEFPGTGIGLATVKRVIHRHGGQIWAEGEKNLGAKFYFTMS